MIFRASGGIIGDRDLLVASIMPFPNDYFWNMIILRLGDPDTEGLTE